MSEIASLDCGRDSAINVMKTTIESSSVIESPIRSPDSPGKRKARTDIRYRTVARIVRSGVIHPCRCLIQHESETSVTAIPAMF